MEVNAWLDFTLQPLSLTRLSCYGTLEHLTRMPADRLQCLRLYHPRHLPPPTLEWTSTRFIDTVARFTKLEELHLMSHRDIVSSPFRLHGVWNLPPTGTV